MSIAFNDNIGTRAPKPTDNRFGKFSAGKWTPFDNLTEALSRTFYRYEGLILPIRNGIDQIDLYWFEGGITDSDLKLFKSTGQAGLQDVLNISNSGDQIRFVQNGIQRGTIYAQSNGSVPGLYISSTPTGLVLIGGGTLKTDVLNLDLLANTATTLNSPSGTFNLYNTFSLNSQAINFNSGGLIMSYSNTTIGSPTLSISSVTTHTAASFFQEYTQFSGAVQSLNPPAGSNGLVRLIDLDPYLLKTGGILTGDVQTAIAPVNGNSLITKGYVDNALTGITWKNAVRLKTTANITLLGPQTIDGIAAVAGNRILVANQTNATQNGIYQVNAGTWTRVTDADSGEELESATVAVTLGTLNKNTQWTSTTSAPIIVGTTNISFGQISGAGTYTNGTGLLLTGNVFSLDTNYTILNQYAIAQNAEFRITGRGLVGGSFTANGSITSNTFIGSQGGFGTNYWSISENTSYIVQRFTDITAPIGASNYGIKFRRDGTGTWEFGADSDTPATKYAGIANFYAKLRAWNAPVIDQDVMRLADMGGYIPAGTNSYIQNQNTLDQTANIRISGKIQSGGNIEATGTLIAYNNFVTRGEVSLGSAVGVSTPAPGMTIDNTDLRLGILYAGGSLAKTLSTGFIISATDMYVTDNSLAPKGLVNGGDYEANFIARSLITKQYGDIRYALSSNIGSYINNGTTVQAGSNFNISGNGTIGNNLTAMSGTFTSNLTQLNTSTGLFVYNTSDIVTNYERFRGYWNANTFFLQTEKGGTGTQRSLSIGTSDGQLVINIGSNFYDFNRGTVNTNVVGFTGTLSGNTGVANVLSLTNTITKSSTAGYRGIYMSVFENTLGTGVNELINLGTNTAAAGAGTHNSKFSVSNTGNVIATGTGSFGVTGTSNGDVNIVNQLTVSTGTSGQTAATFTNSGANGSVSLNLNNTGTSGNSWKILVGGNTASGSAGTGINEGNFVIQDVTAGQNKFMIAKSTGNVGIGNLSSSVMATHSLTLAANTTGIAQYNTADQTTNYERVRQFWSGNIYNIYGEAGGTGTNRALNISSVGGANSLLFSANRGIIASVGSASDVQAGHFSVSGTYNATNVNQKILGITPTISQTGTASYSGLYVSPFESSLGSGVSYLINAGTNAAAGGTGTHTPLFLVDRTGLTTISAALQLGRIAGVVTNGQAAIGYTTSGAGYPFSVNGNLVLQPRSGTAFDVVFMVGATPTTAGYISGTTGNWNLGYATGIDIGSKLAVNGTFLVTGASQLSGGVTITGAGTSFTLGGNALFNNAVTIAGNLQVNQTITRAGNYSATPVLGGSLLNINPSTFTDNNTAASTTLTFNNLSGFSSGNLTATNTAVTYTNANTVYIGGAPTAGSNVTIINPYALYINSGNSYFGGNVTLSSATNNFLNIQSSLANSFPQLGLVNPTANWKVSVNGSGNQFVITDATGTARNVFVINQGAPSSSLSISVTGLLTGIITPVSTSNDNTLATTAFVKTATGTLTRYTASGNGSTTTITIPHGLTGITSTNSVIGSPNSLAATGVQYITVDATNINIFYSVAPVTGTNNLIYSIYIK